MRASFRNRAVFLQENYIMARMTKRESFSPWMGSALSRGRNPSGVCLMLHKRRVPSI